MVDKHALLKWIGGQLNELCGFTEANVTQFVLAIAEKHATSSSSSHKKLYETLKDSGFDAVTLDFSRELCNRLLDENTTTDNNDKAEEKNAEEDRRRRIEGEKEKKKTSTNIADAAYENERGGSDEGDDYEEKKYALVQSSSSDDDHGEEDLERKSKKRRNEKKSKKKSLLREKKKKKTKKEGKREEKKRRKQDSGMGEGSSSSYSSEDEETKFKRERALQGYRDLDLEQDGDDENNLNGEEQEKEELSEETALERERLRDQEEKREFEERLRMKDDAKTKKLVNDGGKLNKNISTSNGEEDEEEVKRGLIPDLRKVSRQEYLKKRELQKLEELKEQIADDEKMYEYSGRPLTEKQKKDLEYKKQTLALAEAQLKNVEESKEELYQMPLTYDDVDDKANAKNNRDKRFQVALERYKESAKSRQEEKEDANPFKEQDEWEDHQIRQESSEVR